MPSKKIVTIVISYIILSLLGCLLYFVGTNYILANFEPVTMMDFDVYNSLLLSWLALTSIFMFILYCVYYTFIGLFDFIQDLYMRSIIGMILGFIVVKFFVHNLTFGGDWFYFDIGLLFEASVIALLGGLIPYVELYVTKMLLKIGNK